MTRTESDLQLTGEDWTRFGRFEDDGRTFAITTPTPPTPWDNYLFNDHYLSVVDHLGRGWSKLHTRRGDVTFLWNLTAMYERDDNRLVFLRDDQTGRFWSLTGWPAGGAEGFQCRHGQGFTELSSCTDGIAATLTVAVPPGSDPVELWSLSVANRSGRRRRISVFTYSAVSLKGALTHGYIHFCQGQWDRQARMLFFQNNAPNLPHGRYKAFQAISPEPDSTDASRTSFRGLYRPMSRPAAVEAGRCGDSPASREGLAACFHKALELDDGAARRLDFVAGLVDSPAQACEHIDRYLGPEKIDAVLAELAERSDAQTRSPRIATPDEKIDRLVNIWARRQVELGARWGRWGWMGYRDIVQQLHGATYFDTRQVGKMLTEAMTWQMRDGFAVRGWAPLSPKRYADSSLWLCYVANDLVKETGQADFVHLPLPYRDGDFGCVWEHLLRGCEKVFTDVGPHGLPRIHQGDWNDSLSAVGEKGVGESVWLAQALCWALLELRELFEATGLDAQARRVAQWRDEMAARINQHAWDGAWYLRGFCDDGRPLGSARSSEGRIYLNTQSWAILGRVATPERQTAMLESVETHLRVPYGYLTLAPPYTTYDPGIGRITGMPPGTGENAAVYVHANAFLYAAMLQMHRPDQALALLETIHPCNAVNPTGNSGATPYALPNSYYGPGYTIRPGRIEGSWVTGSAGWYMHQTIEQLAGLHRLHDGLSIQPQLPSAWPELTVHRRFRGADYDMTVRRDPSAGETTVRLDGQPLDGNVVALQAAGTRHTIEVVVP